MNESDDIATLEKAWKPAFLAALALSPNVAKAARAADICRQHAYKARLTDTEFAAKWDDILEESLDDLEESVLGRAKVDDTTLAIFILKNRRRAIYGDKVSNDVSGRIEVVISHENQNPDQPTYPPFGAGGLTLEQN